MRLWALLDLMKADDRYEVKHPDIATIPDHMYYMVNIVLFRPDKQNPKSKIFVSWRYLGRDPILSRHRLREVREKLEFQC